MKTKLFVVGTLAGALTLFAWESISNTVIPWHDPTMRAFTDSTAAVQAIRTYAPENGMYVDVRGVVAAISLSPDMADKSGMMGLMLGRQLVLDIVVALLLLVAFNRLPRLTTVHYGLASATVALAVSASIFVSDWNWYGFGIGWTLVNTLDRSIGYGLMGLVIGSLMNRWSGRMTTNEWNGVRASGGLPSSLSTPRSSARS